MRCEVLLFITLAIAFTWCSSTLDCSSSAPQQDFAPTKIGDSYRRRNTDAARHCVGTVAQRRRCWLEWPTE
jgi:hypothetical protein